jgi:amino acid transporter
MLVAAGGMASTFGLYSAVLLSVSRVPQVMADDQLLPSVLCTLHRRFGTPLVTIIASSLIVSVLVVFSFSDLVVMDIILYGAGLALEFLALIILRNKEPARPRPFKIPLGRKALPLLFLAPVAIYCIALCGAIYSSGKMALPVVLGLGMLLSAAPAWWFIRWRKPHLDPSSYK